MERRQLTLDYWRQNVDRLLEFNERPVLGGAGSISSEEMKRMANERHVMFDERRRSDEASLADDADLREIEKLEKQIKRSPKEEAGK